MKIQLKRSNVMDGGSAKPPSESQMEYGEIAVNYNRGDPVLFIKDSSDSIIRLAGSGSAGTGDGQININAGLGLSATGNNATANQTINTTRQLAIDTVWLDDRITNVSPDNAGNGQINFNAGAGLLEAGDNATANQTANTNKTFSLDLNYLNNRFLRTELAAGNQTVASVGVTTFAGTISAAKYDLESLPTLP